MAKTWQKIIVIIFILVVLLYIFTLYFLGDILGIPRTPQHIVDKVYDILAKTDRILTQNNLTWWADGGTLLGAVRDKGMIAWDDDADICMSTTDYEKFRQLSQDLDSAGLYLDENQFVPKIMLKNTRFPFLDIFPMTMDKYKGKKRIIFADHKHRKAWPKSFFYYDEVFPIKKIPFGYQTVNVPGHAEKYLNRYFGNWNECIFEKTHDLTWYEKIIYTFPRKVMSGNRVVFPSTKPHSQ